MCMFIPGILKQDSLHIPRIEGHWKTNWNRDLEVMEGGGGNQGW